MIYVSVILTKAVFHMFFIGRFDMKKAILDFHQGQRSAECLCAVNAAAFCFVLLRRHRKIEFLTI